MPLQQIERRELRACPTAVVRATLAVLEIGPFVGQAFTTVAQALAIQRVVPTGPPFARYGRLSHSKFAVEAGFPTEEELSPTGEVVASSLPGGPAAVATYVGPYEQMEPAYEALANWIVEHGGEPQGDPWEVYFSDPAQEPDPQKWRTEIMMPFRA